MIKREKYHKIGFLKDKLNIIYNAPPNNEKLEEIIEAKLDLNLETDKTELYEEQRARSNWLQYSDRNTSSFHSLASTKHQINKIKKLKGEDGSFITKENEMMKIAINYFKDLFLNSRQNNDETVYEKVTSNISSSMNERLSHEFKVEEINEAIQKMGPTKVPRYDGFYEVFFQKFWYILRPVVAQYCLQVLNRKISLNKLNVVFQNKRHDFGEIAATIKKRIMQGKRQSVQDICSIIFNIIREMRELRNKIPTQVKMMTPI
ncbi:hypothetical protein GOBAR_AA04860 [Gossypium barbadense]|uniref:Reverse transcriptase domain-containing protein n=1 Tax=Gossypium barbadense TaxID=3634 RepID=A0A2P5YJF9_GOSBA|nr:hypothetical protein GOBAR_AA04860 [Gossypium barbadense]